MLIENETVDFSALAQFMNDLELFESRYFPKDKINFFDAIGFADQEIRHSRLLAYLLNPNNNHGLDDAFLKILIRTILIDLNGDEKCLALENYIIKDFSDLMVFTEWNRVDIFIESREHKLCIAIENKIKANESHNQLSNYTKIIKEKRNDYTRIHLYLTPDGSEPSNENWIPISYEQIRESISKAKELKNISLTSDSARLITEYITLIEGTIMGQNSNMDDALFEIYNRHKNVFDKMRQVVDNRRDDGSIGQEIRDQLIKKAKNAGKNWELCGVYTWGQNNKSYGLYPKNWENRISSRLQSSWFGMKECLPFIYSIRLSDINYDGTPKKTEILFEFEYKWFQNFSSNIEEIISNWRSNTNDGKKSTGASRGKKSKRMVVIYSFPDSAINSLRNSESNSTIDSCWRKIEEFENYLEESKFDDKFKNDTSASI